MPISRVSIDLMVKKRRLSVFAAPLLAAIVFAPGAFCQTRDLGEAKPESVGFSAQRLERLHALSQKKVDDKQLAGIVTVLARHGRMPTAPTWIR